MIGIVNSGGGGSGGTLTITAPVGATITASKDGKLYTRTVNAAGLAIFRGLSTGLWTLTMTDGVQNPTTIQVNITADYSLTMAFFAAFIQVTYPAGSVCKCTKGATVLTAVGTSGSFTFTVSEPGDWVVSCTDGTDSDSQTVSITTDGQTVSVGLNYNTIPAFTYTGDYEVVDDADNPITESGDNWKVRFLTSGTLVFSELLGAENGIDVFAVGGAAAGQSSTVGKGYYGKGGEAVTSTLSVNAGQAYEIVIGAGGRGNGNSSGNTAACKGGNTECFGLTANGATDISLSSYDTANNVAYEFGEPGARQYAGCRSEAGNAEANTGTGVYNGKTVSTSEAGSGIVIIRNARGGAA